MKIVHISTSEKIGGAALAANRLNTAYIENDDDSIMLVLNRTTSKEGVYTYVEGRKSFYSKFKQVFLEKMKRVFMSPSYTFSLGWCGYNLHKSKIIKDADIIYIHDISYGSYTDEDNNTNTTIRLTISLQEDIDTDIKVKTEDINE